MRISTFLLASMLSTACGSTPLQNPSQTDAGLLADGGSFAVGDGGAVSDGGPAVDGGSTQDGGTTAQTCAELAATFEAAYSARRSCQADSDCTVQFGVCGSFLYQCHYPMSAADAPWFDGIVQQIDQLGCRSEGSACVPCPLPGPARCLNGGCELGCAYVCNLDCICEKDESGCDLPRCADTTGCPDRQGCYQETLLVHQVCVRRRLVAGVTGQALARVTADFGPCTGRPLPCEARLVEGRLEVTPYLTVAPEEDVIDCSPSATTVDCRAPVLAPGAYPVLVNNVPAGEVQVGASVVTDVECFRTDQPEPAHTCTLRTRPDASASCAPGQLPAERWVRLPFTAGCADCFERPGPCHVRIRDGVIDLTPASYRCDCSVCGACPDVCFAVESGCYLPPLPAGSYDLRYLGQSRIVEVAAGVAGNCP